MTDTNEQHFDGSGFYLGQRVFVDDGRVSFHGEYLGIIKGLPTVRDEETDERLSGCIDFISPA